MHRRQYLVAIGTAAAVGVAGCSEEESDRESGSGNGEENGGENGGDSGPLEFLEHEWYNEGEFDAGVRGQLENISDETQDLVNVNVFFIDSEGVQFAEGVDNTTDLAGGRVWEFDAAYLGDGPNRVDNYEIQWEVI